MGVMGLFRLGRDFMVFYEWEFREMVSGAVELEFIIMFDWMRYLFFGLVMLISSFILIYRV